MGEPEQVVSYRDGVRLEDWIWERAGSGGDLQLGCLLFWPESPADSQGMSAGVRGWDKVTRVHMGVWGWGERSV